MIAVFKNLSVFYFTHIAAITPQWCQVSAQLIVPSKFSSLLMFLNHLYAVVMCEFVALYNLVNKNYFIFRYIFVCTYILHDI